MADVAAKTADALLTAMDVEEPFRLLRTLPGRLQELRLVEGRRVDSETRLVEEVALIQSQNYDSICSATSRIQDWTKQVKSISNSHVRRFQWEADVLQDSLEKLRNSRRSNALPRRHRIKGVSSSDIENEISKLQGASARIQGIARYACCAVEGLARDGASLNALAEQTLHEVGLALDDVDNRVRPVHSDDLGPEEVGNSLQTLIQEMEQRCEDVETNIASNNGIIDKQMEEIERLRRALNNSRATPSPVNGGGGAGRELDLIPCFVLAMIVTVVSAILVTFLKMK